MKCFYDLHIHSALSPCSDADMTPNNIVNMALIKGLDMIAISDHNSIGNIKPALECSKNLPLTVLPAMEIETSEEVHILTLFKDLDTALKAEVIVKEHLTKIKNRPEIFGEQLLFDSNDNIIGYEESLLLVATSISVSKLKIEMDNLGAIFIPAHIDRNSYSILSNLGMLPDIGIKCLEVSKKGKLSEYEHLNKRLISNSDAHYLEDVSEPMFYLDLPEKSFDGLYYYINN